MDVKEQRKLDVFLTVLESSRVGPIIASSVFGDGPNVGKKPYDPYRMFAFIVLAFSLKKMTLRDIEDFGRHDLRARYVLGSDLPSYKTIGQYINEVIFPDMETIFHRITSAIAAYCKIEDVFSVAFIDGTKLEADANKYKFVWKPDKRMEKLKATIMSLLSAIGIAVKETEINSVALLGWINAYMSEKKLDSVPVPTKGKRRQWSVCRNASSSSWNTRKSSKHADLTGIHTIGPIMTQLPCRLKGTIIPDMVPISMPPIMFNFPKIMA